MHDDIKFTRQSWRFLDFRTRMKIRRSVGKYDFSNGTTTLDLLHWGVFHNINPKFLKIAAQYRLNDMNQEWAIESVMSKMNELDLDIDLKDILEKNLAPGQIEVRLTEALAEYGHDNHTISDSMYSNITEVLESGHDPRFFVDHPDIDEEMASIMTRGMKAGMHFENRDLGYYPNVMELRVKCKEQNLCTNNLNFYGMKIPDERLEKVFGLLKEDVNFYLVNSWTVAHCSDRKLDCMVKLIKNNLIHDDRLKGKYTEEQYCFLANELLAGNDITSYAKPEYELRREGPHLAGEMYERALGRHIEKNGTVKWTKDNAVNALRQSKKPATHHRNPVVRVKAGPKL